MTHLRVDQPVASAGDAHRLHILCEEQPLARLAIEWHTPEMAVGAVDERPAIGRPCDTRKIFGGGAAGQFAWMAAIGVLQVDLRGAAPYDAHRRQHRAI